MRYSIKARYGMYLKGYGFLPFTKNMGHKYSQKLLDTVTKSTTDATKTVSKREVKKAAEATGDLIGYKTADKITKFSKMKEAKNKLETCKERYISLDKKHQIIYKSRLF